MKSLRAKVDEIFWRASRLASPEERNAYLDQACENHAPLRAEVEKLLRAAPKAERFLEPPLAAPAALCPPITEKPGTLIGPYKLLEQIGEGGMGLVFMARQQEPVKRNVALKVVKPGMDSRQVIARFEAERQALALMDHLNIARVLDAGSTESGRPYFVMDLVKGIPITDYCDRERLSIRERLDLFIPVCQAVQHAHQKGVIHRDIKPSNVLVTLHDGTPVPKVIDFGVAKAIHRELTQETLVTGFAQVIGTPLYMSPEQVAMSGLDVDTRADIYSLGVLLYELLTGTTPVERQRLREAAYDDIRRIICAEEPTRPSAKVSTLGKEAAPVFENRRSDPKRLSALIHGDLDWIVMKALEKDRTRRYETANDLASDIRRHLNNEPVAARPPSALYRLTKFARRNKTALLTAAAVALALVVGLVISTRQAVRATRAERLAQEESQRSRTEAGRANAVVSLLLAMLDSANPDDAKGTDYTVRELLDEFSRGLDGQLEDQPEVEATIRATIGNAYRRLALPEQAEPHLKAALDLRRRVFGDEHEMVAKSLLDYAFNLWERDRKSAEAVALARDALAIYRRQGGQTEQMIVALRHLLLFLGSQNRNAEAEAAGKEALAIAEQLHIEEHPDVAIILHNLAQIKTAQGDYVQAESLGRKALAMHRKVHGNEHPETAWALMALANALWFLGEIDEAETLYREALPIFNRQFGESYRGADAALRGLAAVLTAKGDYAGAESVWQEALTVRRERFGPEHLSVAIALRAIALVLESKGDDPAAEPYYHEAIAILQKSPGDVRGQIELAGTLVACGDLLHRTGRLGDAKQHYQQAIAVYETLAGQSTGEDVRSALPTSPLQAKLGDAYLRISDYRQALTHLTNAIDLDPSDGWAYLRRSVAFFDAGEYERSLADADDAVRLVGGWYSYQRRADAYQALKQYDKATADYQVAEEKNRKPFEADRDSQR
jgi:serine/threonine protein kinase/tetratricopeptide (TPR) repeat protein